MPCYGARTFRIAVFSIATDIVDAAYYPIAWNLWRYPLLGILLSSLLVMSSNIKLAANGLQVASHPSTIGW